MMWWFIPSIILAILAGLFVLAARPTKGSVDANVILIIPAVVLGILSLIAALAAWLL